MTIDDLDEGDAVILNTLQGFWQSMAELIGIQYRDYTETTRTSLDLDDFRELLATNWDREPMLELFTPFINELSKFDNNVNDGKENMDEDTTNSKEEMDEDVSLKDRLKRVEKELEKQKKINQQQKQNKKDEEKRRKTSKYLSDIVKAGDKNNPVVLGKNVFQQILEGDLKNRALNVELNTGKKASEEDDEIEWLETTLPKNVNTGITNSIEDMFGRIGQCTTSNAMAISEVAKVMHCSM